MANNKVQLADGTVLIDLTDTTAKDSDVAKGKYFYNAAGVRTPGTASGGTILTWDDVVSHTFPLPKDCAISSNAVISDYALAYTDIVTLSAPNLTDPKTALCYGCSKLKSVSLPSVPTLYGKNNLFQNCVSLTRVSLPKCTILGTSTFEGCSSLTALVFERVNRTYNNTFSNCSKLKSVDFLVGVYFGGGNTFANDTVLDTLILRGNTVSGLANINNFANTPFASGKAGGTLYVPQTLVSDYQSATNWSTILGYANNQILPIEGSIYENQYADGTPIT